MTYSIILTKDGDDTEYWADFASGQGLSEFVDEINGRSLSEVSQLVTDGWADDIPKLREELTELIGATDNENVAHSAEIVLDTIVSNEITSGVATLTNGIGDDIEPVTESTDVDEVAQSLATVADSLISVAVLDRKLIGNFGDWAEAEQLAEFDRIAQELGYEPVHENEVSDLVELYPGAVDVELPKQMTRTQEDLLSGWKDYP